MQVCDDCLHALIAWNSLMTHDFKKCRVEVLQRLNFECHTRVCCGLYQAALQSVRECEEGEKKPNVCGWYIAMIMWSNRAIKAGVMQFASTAMST